MHIKYGINHLLNLNHHAVLSGWVQWRLATVQLRSACRNKLRGSIIHCAIWYGRSVTVGADGPQSHGPNEPSDLNMDQIKPSSIVPLFVPHPFLRFRICLCLKEPASSSSYCSQLILASYLALYFKMFEKYLYFKMFDKRERVSLI